MCVEVLASATDARVSDLNKPIKRIHHQHANKVTIPSAVADLQLNLAQGTKSLSVKTLTAQHHITLAMRESIKCHKRICYRLYARLSMFHDNMNHSIPSSLAIHLPRESMELSLEETHMVDYS